FDQVKIKLSAVEEVVKNKDIVLVDDSIVRGTTCERIVSLLKEAGANRIHMRVSAPQFLYPCFYGTDIDSQENLISCHHSVQEISEMIGVDSLGFLPLKSLQELSGNMEYCSACFDGRYPTKVPSDTRKNRFEQRLSEKKK
ncbi:MAG: amidophosphoribosyltransferase, partial [Lachnospiraceae bacterium]|nr:amidophosphoribosyltransferase [Lachnospiraceae bacterium]